jgi:ferredoxin-NADP reductase
MISGGSGITPVMSHVRTLLRDGYDGKANRKVTFLHFARSAEDQIFAEELERIAAEDNHVEVHLRHGEQTFSEFELRRLVPDFASTDTWACGPAGLIELVRAAYGEDNPRLRVEFFKPPVVAVGNAEGDVNFTRSGVGAANTGQSLLEQAEALGLSPEFGCRMGICFSCTKTKTEGTVRNVLTGEESSLPNEEVRLCVSAPVGDCSVEL